jgi:hypothetical protein
MKQGLKLNGIIILLMGTSICDTVETLLASVEEELDDPDLIFKLRTARQLNLACKDEMTAFQRTVEQADLDEETETRLEELGYL